MAPLLKNHYGWQKWIHNKTAARYSFIWEEALFSLLLINALIFCVSLALRHFGLPHLGNRLIPLLAALSSILFGITHKRRYCWENNAVVDKGATTRGDTFFFILLGAFIRIGYFIPGFYGIIRPLSAFAIHAIYDNCISQFQGWPVGMMHGTTVAVTEPTTQDRIEMHKPYDDIASCARFAITIHPDDPLMRQVIADFFSYLDSNEQLRKMIVGESRFFGHRVRDEILLYILMEPTDAVTVSPEILQLLMESALEVIMVHDTTMGQTEKLTFIKEAMQKNHANFYLRSAYNKLENVLNRMFTDKFVIIGQENQKKLVPVITYVSGTDQRASLDTYLSFISTTRDEYSNRMYMPDRISLVDEMLCMLAFSRFINVYTKVENWQGKVLDSLLNTVYHFIKNSTPENISFLKERLSRICTDDTAYIHYWDKIKYTSTFDSLKKEIYETLDSTRVKELCDFCALLLALVLWYGGGRVMQQKIERRYQILLNKYKNRALVNKMGIFVLPIDFAFMRHTKEPSAYQNEHTTLLNTLKSINPGTKVQGCVESLVWTRDTFAWLDADFKLFMRSITPLHDMSKGLLSEGGNIIPGKAAGNFILVSQEAVGGEFTTAGIWSEARKYGMSVYTFPVGFSWARNMRTNEDIALDSKHIDTVINFIPAQCTNDKRSRIIIDPYYHQLIKDTADFKRFQKEQAIPDSQIIVIDERELYLNLANFSVIMAPDGQVRLLFNKDKGYTLPRLNIKKSVLVQPDIEIVNISIFNGNIRCVTNMVPEAYVKTGSSLVIIPEDTLPQDFEKSITALFVDKPQLTKALSMLWVSNVYINSRPKAHSCEMDTLSRTIFIALDQNDLSDSAAACRFIEKSIQQLCERLGQDMGISVEETDIDHYALRPLAVSAKFRKIGYFIKVRSGELIRLTPPASENVLMRNSLTDFYRIAQDKEKLVEQPVTQKSYTGILS